MQKVSKQSLAMLTLSILLAISIALTFTFATVQSTKTATGTIVFSGAAALQLNGFAGDENAGTFNISVNNNTVKYNTDGSTEVELSTMGFKLASTSAPAYVKVALSVNGENIEIASTVTDTAVAVYLQQATGFGTTDGTTMTTTNKQNPSASWTLDQVLSVVADATKYAYEDDNASKVTLTITADVTKTNL